MDRSFKRLEGTLPRKPEIGEWSEPRIRAFFAFANFFMGEVDGKLAYKVTDEQIANAWELNEEYWPEFLHRITTKGMPDLSKAQRLNAFRTRLMNFIRTVCSWVKANQHALTPELEELMRSNPRFAWALDTFTTDETSIGDTIIVPNDVESVRHLPGLQFQNHLAKATSLLGEMLSSIDRNQLKGLPAEKKLRLALQMIDTLARTMKDAPQKKSVFNTLILQKGGREDLEKSIMHYVEQD